MSAPESEKKLAEELLCDTEAKTTADGLANLPRDYAGLPTDDPKLGPPLPRDLGRKTAWERKPVSKRPFNRNCASRLRLAVRARRGYRRKRSRHDL